MYPEDRVLVGVIKAKRDLDLLRNEHWYRIPQPTFPRGIHTEYLAFFLSGTVFKERSGAIHYFAPYRGVELRYRHELIPNQPDHARANNVYYKVAVGEIAEKEPPIVNTTKRAFAFIVTTWDRFVGAATIPELYSESDYFVDRIYHALTDRGFHPERTWSAQRKEDDLAPALRILCQSGVVTATALHDAAGSAYMDQRKSDDAILNEILMHIAQQGGAVMLNIPAEG